MKMLVALAGCLTSLKVSAGSASNQEVPKNASYIASHTEINQSGAVMGK